MPDEPNLPRDIYIHAPASGGRYETTVSDHTFTVRDTVKDEAWSFGFEWARPLKEGLEVVVNHPRFLAWEREMARLSSAQASAIPAQTPPVAVQQAADAIRVWLVQTGRYTGSTLELQEALVQTISGVVDPDAALRSAVKRLRTLAREWYGAAEWMMGSSKPDSWQRAGSAYLRQCARQLDNELDALAVVRTPQVVTECCEVSVDAYKRFCPKCGYEFRVIP